MKNEGNKRLCIPSLHHCFKYLKSLNFCVQQKQRCQDKLCNLWFSSFSSSIFTSMGVTSIEAEEAVASSLFRNRRWKRVSLTGVGDGESERTTALWLASALYCTHPVVYPGWLRVPHQSALECCFWSAQ